MESTSGRCLRLEHDVVRVARVDIRLGLPGHDVLDHASCYPADGARELEAVPMKVDREITVTVHSILITVTVHSILAEVTGNYGDSALNPYGSYGKLRSYEVTKLR